MLLGRHGPVLLTAEANGTALSAALVNTFDTVASRAGQHLTVIDVVPPRPGDSDALSLFFVILGVLFPSLGAGAGSAIVFRRSRPIWCVAVLLLIAALAGLAAAAIADEMTGLGHYATVAGIAALFSLAVSAPTAVFGRIRPPLVVLGLLIFVVLGLPVSGGPGGLSSFGYGFLRDFYPVLPLGVAVAALRNAVYFHGYGTTAHLWILAAWALGGLAVLTSVVTVGRRVPSLATSSLDDDALVEIAPIDAALFDPNYDTALDDMDIPDLPKAETTMDPSA